MLDLGGQIPDAQQMFALVRDDSKRSRQTVMLVHHTLHSCTFHQFYDQPQTAGLGRLHERIIERQQLGSQQWF